MAAAAAASARETLARLGAAPWLARLDAASGPNDHQRIVTAEPVRAKTS